MGHFHVIVIEKGDKHKGALTTTEAAALAEAAVEREAGRDTDIERCAQACFPEPAPA